MALGLLACAVAWAQGPLTEEQFVEQVLAGSLEAQVADAEAALGQAEAVGAGAWPNPSLGWERERASSGSRSGESQDTFAASLPLVLSGRLGLEADAAARGAEVAAARGLRARALLRHEATRAFAALLGAQERRRILEVSLGQLQVLAGAIAAREASGDAAGYERLRIELEAAAADDLLRGAQQGERQAQAEALRLLPPSVREVPPVQGPLAPQRPLPDVAALLARLEESRADVRALSLEVEGAQAAARAAGRRWIPEPTVSGGVQRLDVGQEGSGTGYGVGLSVPLPLFEHGQRERAQARARRTLAETRRAALLHEARARLVAVAGEAASRRERLQRHRSEVLARAEELRRIAGAAYRGGAADLLLLVDAERAARDAQLAAVELAQAAADAEADLLLLAGAHDGAAPRSPSR